MLIYVVAAALCMWRALRALRDRSHPGSAAFTTLALTLATTLLLAAPLRRGFDGPLAVALVAAYGAVAAWIPPLLLRTFRRVRGGDVATEWEERLRWLAALLSAGWAAAAALDQLQVLTLSRASVVLGALTGGAFLAPVLRLVLDERRAPYASVRARIRVLLGLLLAMVLFTALEWFAGLPPLGAVLSVIFVLVLHRVVVAALDIRELVARGFTLTVAAVTLALAQELALDLQPAGDQDWSHRTFWLLMTALPFLLFWEPMERFLAARAGQWFNLPGWHLERTLDEVDASLAKVLSLSGLETALLDPLHASGRAPLVSLYLWQPEQGLYKLMLQRGGDARAPMTTIAPRPFTDGLGASGVCARDALQRALRRGAGEEAADRLRVLDAMDADLTLPFVSAGLVVGWLNLRAAEGTEGFAPHEIRRLRSTADRVAVVLENLGSVEALAEQRRLVAVGTMAAGLAHEIRNPLAGIKGAAQVLQGADAPAGDQEFLGIIVDEVNRLNEVVTQFLDYARPLKVHPESTDVRAVVHAVLELVRREGLPPGLVLRSEFASDLPDVPMDRDKIKQVLLNLVQNAVQAVRDQGEVVVSVTAAALSTPAARAEEGLAIQVSDTGPGIPQEDLEKLFIPFYTTRQGGTGLGLAISQRLIVAHGGEIAVRSQPGQGSSFTVRLPRYPERMEPRSPSIPR